MYDQVIDYRFYSFLQCTLVHNRLYTVQSHDDRPSHPGTNHIQTCSSIRIFHWDTLYQDKDINLCCIRRSKTTNTFEIVTQRNLYVYLQRLIQLYMYLRRQWISKGSNIQILWVGFFSIYYIYVCDYKWMHLTLYFLGFVCLFVCLFVVPIKNFSLIWRRHHYRWRTANYDPYSALMVIEQWGFFSVPHLLWHWASVYNGHLWGPVTHILPSV